MSNRVLLLTCAASFLSLSTPARCAQIDWWRTNGAAVVEHQYDGGGVVCSLFLYNKDLAAVVTWGKTDTKEISFYDDDWRFQADQVVSVGVRIGAGWLGNPSDRAPPILMAVGGSGRLSVPISLSVDDLLRTAAQITLRLNNGQMSIDIDQHKMPVLLTAVERCRASLK